MAAVAGAALALAFPPFGASVLAPLAVAALTLSQWRSRTWEGAALGGIFGIAFFAILLRWVGLVGGDAWVLLTLFCAGWLALLGAATALLMRLPWWPLWVAGAWVLEEALRDRIPLGGFPWGRLAFAQTATTLTPWASVAGAPLVTFATALAGTLIAFIVIAWRRQTRQHRRDVALAAGGVVVIALSGLALPRPVAGEAIEGPSEVVIAVIQGGVPSTGLGERDDRREVLDRHVRETIALSERVAAGQVAAPDLVVWPENSSDIDPLADAEAAAQIDRAADAIGVPILVGAVLGIDDSSVANVGIVWDPGTGPGETYIKRRPVPFGEYVPWRPVLSRVVGRFERIPRDFIAGPEPGVLQVGPARIGDVICFEIAYDSVVREAVTGGGRAIVVQTNNATFAGLGQPEQQIAMSRLRAVEHGRSVVVAATSGISAVIDPAGRLVSELGEGETGALVETIPLRDSITLADRVGAWPEYAVGIAVAIGLVWALRRRHVGSPA